MSKYIESFVTSQRPQFYNSEKSRTSDLIPEQQKQTADVLIKLLEDYYEHLSQSGMPTYELNKILTEQDIDSASQVYLEKIQKEIAATFPQSLGFNKVSFYKRIVDYYSSRGTEDSALVFFKLFFDETVEIFYPKDFLFRLSEGRWELDPDLAFNHVIGYLNNDYEITDRDIGTTLDFINRPVLTNLNDLSFYIHGGDGDSAISGSKTWYDLSGNSHDVKLLESSSENANTSKLHEQYSLIDKGYIFNENSDDRHFGQISGLNYGNSNPLPELSVFAWVKNLNGSSGMEGLWQNTNWAIIDFDRSEVFNMWINPDGYLSFSGRDQGAVGAVDPSVGSNTIGGYAPLMDLSANGKTIGTTIHTTVTNGPYAEGVTQFTVADATGITVGMNIYAVGLNALCTVSAVNTATNTIDVTGGAVRAETLTNNRDIWFTEITGSFHGDGEYRLNDENYHYVGVTYSVSQQRILFWIDGKCAAIFTPRTGKTLNALGTTGQRRYGIIGDGSESAESGNSNDNYGNTSRNKTYMKGVISSIHLFEAEICNNDVAISVGDTNTRVSANMEATRPIPGNGNPAYPEKQKGTLTRYIIDEKASESSIDSGVVLSDALRAYYDFGITQTYPETNSSQIFDISPQASSHGTLTGEHTLIANNYVQFDPGAELSGISQQRALTDSIGNIKLHNTLQYGDEHTILCWAKIDVGYDGAGFNVAGYERELDQAFGCLVMYDNQNHTGSLELFVNYVDGSIGRFCPPSNFNITTTNAEKVLANYWQGTSSEANKIKDFRWHLLAIKGTHSGNDGSIAVSVDGAAFETIFTGNSTTDHQGGTRSTNEFLSFTPEWFDDTSPQINFSGATGSYINTQMEKKGAEAALATGGQPYVTVTSPTNPGDINGVYKYVEEAYSSRGQTYSFWYNSTYAEAEGITDIEDHISRNRVGHYFVFNRQQGKWKYSVYPSLAVSGANSSQVYLPPSGQSGGLSEADGFWAVNENQNWEQTGTNMYLRSRIRAISFNYNPGATGYYNKFPSEDEQPNLTYVIKFNADTIDSRNSTDLSSRLWADPASVGSSPIFINRLAEERNAVGNIEDPIYSSVDYRLMSGGNSNAPSLGLAIGDRGLILYSSTFEGQSVYESFEGSLTFNHELLTIIPRNQLSANVDYTVVISLDRTNGIFKSWVNGELTAERTSSWGTPFWTSPGSSSITDSTFSNEAGFYIGANGLDGSDAFNGKMTMVAVDTSLWNDTKANNIFLNPFDVTDFVDPIFVYHFNDRDASLGTPTSQMTSTAEVTSFKTTPTLNGSLNYIGSVGQRWELTIGNTQGAGGATPLFYGVQHTPVGSSGPTNPFGGVYNRPTTFPFSGKISSVFLYNKQLSDSEISTIYDNTQFRVRNNIIISQSGYENTSNKYKLYYEGVNHTNASTGVSEIEFEDIGGDVRLISPEFIEGSRASGKYTSKKGFLSHTNKLLDSDYWQDFSYEIRSGISSEKWLNEFLTLVHPAGIKLFAAFLLRVFQTNTWDYELIDEFYNVKKLLQTLDPESQEYENASGTLERLKDSINSFYKFPIDSAYKEYNQWIRTAPAGSYGIPTFQPGYLYREFAVIQFLVEGFLTPTQKVLNADGTDAQPEVNYWISFGKNYIGHIVFETLVQNLGNINSRMFDQFVNGQLKFGKQEKMTSYLNSNLNDGALDLVLDPTKKLKFGGMSSQVFGIGGVPIDPYERGFLGGTTYTNSDADYIESSTDTDNDSPAAVSAPYENSTTEIERDAFPELI